jgi:DNA-directed RNA polymerase specialized sigma24 family protein
MGYGGGDGMGTEKENPMDFFDPDGDGEVTEMVSDLRRTRDAIRAAEATFARTVVQAHDQGGFTFREIGEITEIAYSWIHKIYRRAKKNR